MWVAWLQIYFLIIAYYYCYFCLTLHFRPKINFPQLRSRWTPKHPVILNVIQFCLMSDLIYPPCALLCSLVLSEGWEGGWIKAVLLLSCTGTIHWGQKSDPSHRRDKQAGHVCGETITADMLMHKAVSHKQKTHTHAQVRDDLFTFTSAIAKVLSKVSQAKENSTNQINICDKIKHIIHMWYN